MSKKFERKLTEENKVFNEYWELQSFLISVKDKIVSFIQRKLKQLLLSRYITHK